MRAPTSLEVIVASAAVGILVLFMKRPEPPPYSRSEPSTASAPVFALPFAESPGTGAIARRSSGFSTTFASQLPPWDIPDPDKLRMTPSGDRCVTGAT
jgi:hypothetical protein